MFSEDFRSDTDWPEVEEGDKCGNYTLRSKGMKISCFFILRSGIYGALLRVWGEWEEDFTSSYEPPCEYGCSWE